MKFLAFLTVLVFFALSIVFYFKAEQDTSMEMGEYETIEETIVEEEKPKTIAVKKEVSKEKVRKKPNALALKKVVKVKPSLPAKNKKNIIPKEFSYVDEKGNLYVESVIIDGQNAISFGDVIIGDADDIVHKAQRGDAVSIKKPAAWPGGEVPYSIDDAVPDKERITNTMENLSELVDNHVRFVPREGQQNFLHFQRGSQNCYSYVGMQGGGQKVSLSDSCQHREILHELVHAIGFFHEQNREDRDEFIEVHFYNIDEKFHPQFKKITNSWQYLFDTDFDFKSIMLYPPNAFSLYENDYSMTTVEGDPYSMNAGTLSDTDIFRIKSLYPAE